MRRYIEAREAYERRPLRFTDIVTGEAVDVAPDPDTVAEAQAYGFLPADPEDYFRAEQIMERVSG